MSTRITISNYSRKFKERLKKEDFLVYWFGCQHFCQIRIFPAWSIKPVIKSFAQYVCSWGVFKHLSLRVQTKAVKILEEETNMKMYYATCLLVALAISVQSGPIPKQDEQDDTFAEVMNLYSTFHSVHPRYLQH